MKSLKTNKNFITERRINIASYLNTFFPNVISNLIVSYDCYLKGEAYNLIGFGNAITCLAILSDGRIVSGSNDKTIKIWNVETGKCDVTFAGHKGGVSCIATFPDSSCRIITGSFGEDLQIWNTHSWDNSKEISQTTLQTGVFGDVISINICPNDPSNCSTNRAEQILIIKRNGPIGGIFTLWDIPYTDEHYTNQVINHYSGIGINHYIGIHTMLHDGRIVIPSGNTFGIYNVRTAKCDITFGDSHYVVSLYTYIDGRIIGLYHDYDEMLAKIKLWNPETGYCDKTFNISVRRLGWGTLDVRVLPDGRIVVMDDDALKIYDMQTETGNCEMTLEDTSDTNSCIAIFPDGRIVTGSTNGTIKIWS
jgi:WD40 repeat protein